MPVLHHVKGAQLYENVMFALSQGAARLVLLAGTRRLQPQLRVLMAAFVASLVAVPLLLAWPMDA